jgi:hypothetical protein
MPVIKIGICLVMAHMVNLRRQGQKNGGGFQLTGIKKAAYLTALQTPVTCYSACLPFPRRIAPILK